MTIYVVVIKQRGGKLVVRAVSQFDFAHAQAVEARAAGLRAEVKLVEIDG